MTQKGQVSIFLGITLLVVMTFIAFVVNVGMFVKAKINLQNAVDAAAWAGAAVQARQLTNIAYLNWEMRNTYKEWMFKYYVLGHLTRDSLRSPNIDQAVRTNFRLRPFYSPGDENYDPRVFDRFNVPSICIHFGSEHDLCDTAMIPGLPRFSALGLPSISEHYQSLINSIVREKSSDCSRRTDINFGTAVLWAYGTRNPNLFPNLPQVAAHRPGAWTESIELALRMRNLEMIVNLPPISSPLCADAGGAGVPCTSISSLEGRADIPLYERPLKAFWSAYRNLGGGESKGGSPDDTFTNSFNLTELPPTPFEVPPTSLSGFLIPPGDGLIKHYLDLQAYSINLSTFYTTFVSDSGTFKNQGTVTGDESRCAGTKTALPVPGYIFGFVKNPAVMTYYAVKGEANYVGLFFPFGDADKGITLSAYAAAKPFGGRIGPRLFSIDPSGDMVRPRNEMARTGPYVSGFNISPLTGGRSWGPLLPLPFDNNYWIINPARSLGGTPKSGGEIYFGIPNLLYDFDNIGEIAPMTSGAVIEILEPALNDSASRVINERMGLYDARQYKRFRSNLTTSGGVILSAKDMDNSLNNARKPTRYEALNYLIPTRGNYLESKIDSQQTITGTRNSLFAPLFGKDTLFSDINTITGVINSYLDYNRPAMEKYLSALKAIADSMRRRSLSTQSRDAYLDAADTIHKVPLAISGSLGSPGCKNLAMAQVFNQFFNGSSIQCDITPLSENIISYFSDQISSPIHGDYQHFYTASYVASDTVGNTELMSAYFPSKRQGASDQGEIASPFPGPAPVISKRNYYSTKFFAIGKILQSGSHPYHAPPLYIEKNMSSPPTDPGVRVPIRNTLPSGVVAEFGSSPPH